MTSSPSLIDAISRAYSGESDDSAWISEVIGAVRPALDCGHGIFGWFYDARDFANVRFSHVTSFGVRDPLIPAIVAASKDASTTLELTQRHYSTPVGTFSQSLGAAFRDYSGWRRHVYPTGVKDLLVVNALDPDRVGCAISAPRKVPSSLGVERAALLARVGAHIAAAHRLRRVSSAQTDKNVEAILAPTGKVEHALGSARSLEARNALSSAARAADRARGRLRRVNPTEAIQIWKAMVAGRWTLVDKLDSDGKRFIVARVNLPNAPRLPRLTDRERQIAGWASLGHSNKLIAYELGLSVSAVGSHLANVVRKLGLNGTSEIAHVAFSSPRQQK